MNKRSIVTLIPMIIIVLIHITINYKIQSSIFSNLIWYYETAQNWNEISSIFVLISLDISISFAASRFISNYKRLLIGQLADLPAVIIMSLIIVMVFIKDVVFTMHVDVVSLQLSLMILAESILIVERFIIAHIPICLTISSVLKKIKRWV